MLYLHIIFLENINDDQTNTQKNNVKTNMSDLKMTVNGNEDEIETFESCKMLSQSISSLGWVQNSSLLSDWRTCSEPIRTIMSNEPLSSKELIPMFEVDFSFHLYFYS